MNKPLPGSLGSLASLRPLLASAVLCGNAAPAATVLPAETLAAATALAAEAAAALAPQGARIAVEPGVLDARLVLAACSRVDAYLPKGQPAWGRTRVGLRCSDGAVRWNVFLPMTVRAWAPALVSKAALPTGAQLAAPQLVVADVDWAAAPQQQPPFAAAAAGQLAGRTLLRPLAAGQALRPADLQPRQWFAIGDTVQVQAEGSGFAVQAEGRALTPGYEGQPARVRVGGSDGQPARDLSGRPVAERKLALRL